MSYANVVATLALVFAFVAITLTANQVASGLALSILGVGLSAFIGKPYESLTLAPVPALALPLSTAAATAMWVYSSRS